MSKQEDLDKITKVGTMLDEVNSQLTVLNATLEEDCSGIVKYNPNLFIGIATLRIRVAEVIVDLHNGRKLYSETFLKQK